MVGCGTVGHTGIIIIDIELWERWGGGGSPYLIASTATPLAWSSVTATLDQASSRGSTVWGCWWGGGGGGGMAGYRSKAS